MSSPYSESIVHAFHQFFRENSITNFRFLEDSGCFKFDAHLENRLRMLHYLVDVRMNGFTVYSFFPFRVDCEDTDALSQTSELLNRINCTLSCGSMELNYDTGSIRFKDQIHCPDGYLLTEDTIWESIGWPAAVFEHYCDALAAFIFTKLPVRLSPEEAMAICSQDPDEEEVPAGTASASPEPKDFLVDTDASNILLRMVQKMQEEDSTLT